MEDTWWDAPWGKGRPGWHIECSAMAEETLGAPFEIHGGGNDLIFPHHENEAAQTLAARGRELAQIWMHNGMLELGGKMSKSVGNIRSLADVLDAVGRDTLLMYFAEGHYRQPLAFADKLEDAARRGEGCAPRARRWCRRLAGRAGTARARLDALAETTTPPRASPRFRVFRRRTARRAVGDAHAPRCFLLGPRTCSTATTARGRGRRARRAARPARAARTSRGRPPARRAARARLGGPGRAGRPRARAVGPDRLRAERGREAIAARARPDVWRRGGGRDSRTRCLERDDIAARRLRGHQASAPTSRNTATPTPPRCSRNRPLLVALDAVPTRRTRCGRPDGRSVGRRG